MEWLILAGVVTVLVLANGVYVAAEFSILSVPVTQLEQRSQEKWAVRMLQTVRNTARQDRYIAVAQLGITMASLGLGMYGEHRMAEMLGPHLHVLGLGEAAAHGIATVAALAGLTYVHIVVGEMVPKSLALMHPLATSRWLDLPMLLSGWVLKPLVWGLNALGNLVLKMLRLPVSQELALVYSQDELRLVFEESREEGLLEETTHEWLQNLMDLRKRTVRQVMVGRTRVVGLPAGLVLEEAMPRIREEGYTRYPVFETDMDHITGVVHVRDLFGPLRRGATDRPLGELQRPALYLPESMHLDAVLEKMRDEKTQFAVVVDEHGGTAGIVTLEDLLEEIIGEVFDEFDVGESAPIASLGPDAWMVQGDVVLEDLSETVGRDMRRADVETLAGLVMDLLGRPPRPGDEVEWAGVSIAVETVAEMVAARCRVRRGPEPPGEG